MTDGKIVCGLLAGVTILCGDIEQCYSALAGCAALVQYLPGTILSMDTVCT